MQWTGRDESDNVEDRRGITGGHVAIGGGVVGVIILLLNYFLSGGDTSQLMNQVQNMQQQSSTQQSQVAPANDTLRQFAGVVLKDCEDVWTDYFNKIGKQYVDPKLVLYTDATQSGCGGASSAMGPFYCPADHKVYLDMSFFQELKDRFGTPGTFAMAYVIAHEVGHHIQFLLGTTDKVEQMEQQTDKVGANKISVKLELQADFYAGVWAHYEAQKENANGSAVIQPGDIESALGAASAVGDDKLQEETEGKIVPDAFTHGTSAQRMYWFKKGYDTGDISQGNTFADVQ